jgi:hypothetical protein
MTEPEYSTLDLMLEELSDALKADGMSIDVMQLEATKSFVASIAMFVEHANTRMANNADLLLKIASLAVKVDEPRPTMINRGLNQGEAQERYDARTRHEWLERTSQAKVELIELARSLAPTT